MPMLIHSNSGDDGMGFPLPTTPSLCLGIGPTRRCNRMKLLADPAAPGNEKLK